MFSLYLYLALALLVGIITGIFTGLAPGIHINLIAALLFAAATSITFVSELNPLVLAVFLVSIAITHIFIDFIPSIFLGAPDEDSYLSILPGHEMLIKGKGYQAIVLTLYGCLAGLFLILVFSPIFYFFLPKIYPYAERIMPYILVLASFFLIYFEKTSRLKALIVFLLSGFLGIATLNLPIKESLLPLFTGLFGVSSLVTSISKKQKIPKQEIEKIKNIGVGKKSFLKSIFASIIASPLCSFLPGMGSGQAAVIGSEVIGELNRKEFLVLLGIISTTVTGLSFITLYSIGKARTGIAVAIGKFIELSLKDIIIISIAIILTGIIAFFISVFIARIFSKYISKINYRLLSLIILLILVVVCFLLSGFLGILVLAVSTAVGLTCIYLGIRRTHMMGCLLLPTILLYLL